MTLDSFDTFHLKDLNPIPYMRENKNKKYSLECFHGFIGDTCINRVYTFLVWIYGLEKYPDSDV